MAAPFAFASNTASACNMAPDYNAPKTNFELVQQADTILTGTLVRSVGNDEYVRKILVKPTLLLKGSALPETAYIRGYLSDRTYEMQGKKYRLIIKKSDPLDLWRPHPEVWQGGCWRQSFEKGSQLLLFFNKRDNTLEWFNPPFTRSSEDITGPDSLWVRAVTTYVRISKLPAPDQRPALVKELEALRKDISYERNGNSLLADDIERVLAGVGPTARFEPQPNADKYTKWAFNISDANYLSVPEAVEVKGQKAASRPQWTTIATSLGLLFIIGLGGVLVVTRRKKKLLA
ncbi:MAG: hypothetical protein IPH79_06900 [Sphingomonadales bacterium]|nr:hypothetical protein [Sphingomonadales bacterium]